MFRISIIKLRHKSFCKINEFHFTESGFFHLKELLPKISKAKIKESIFRTSDQEVTKRSDIRREIGRFRKAAWNSLKGPNKNNTGKKILDGNL